MTGNEDFRGGNFIGGSGNITTGTFTDSPVVSVSGSNNKVTTDVSDNSVALDPWGDLEKELARIRRRLEADRGSSVAVVDRDDAMASVKAAQAEASAADSTSPEARRSIRLRIKGLIGILAPVAEIIGGVAALEAIWPHL
jgi:hypothetical protein